MRTIPTVHQLRLSGKPVEITHRRNYYKYDSKTGKKHILLLSYEEYKQSHSDYYLDAKGGATYVTIYTDASRTENFSVIAVCSKFDPYNRKTGVRIGVGKAFSKMSSIKN